MRIHIPRMSVATLTIAVLGSCGGAPPAPTSTTGQPATVQFTEQQTSSAEGDCSQPDAHCAQATIHYQQATGGGSDAVCESVDLFVRHQLVSWLRARVPQDQRTPTDLASLAQAYTASYGRFIAANPDSVQRWSLEATCSVPYNTPVVTTIDCRIQDYSGGAHPNSERHLASFAVATGELLAPADVVSDRTRLERLAEAAFRAQRGLDPGADLVAAGFDFPDDSFALTDNFAVMAEGLLFHWDTYEIAPYAMGPTDVLIPAAELKGITTMELWPPEHPG